MTRSYLIAAAVAAAALSIAGCETAPKTSAERNVLVDRAQSTVAEFRNEDPSIQRFFDDSVGYAVFPEIAKGGLVVGGAHGRGVLYEDGRMVGYCDLTQGSVGAQIGGQTYSEIIFFQNHDTLNNFKNERLEFAAQASAVAVRAGASANADYDDGVAVFTMGEGGLMLEASVGGQEFDYIAASTYDE